MSLLGDLGRALALLYPYRVPITIGAAIPRVGIAYLSPGPAGYADGAIGLGAHRVAGRRASPVPWRLSRRNGGRYSTR